MTNTRKHSQKGTTVLLVAVLIAVLLAFVGLAFDASFMYLHKRRMQTAADAGAFGGAMELMRGNNSTVIEAAARRDSQINRFTHATDDVNVTVNPSATQVEVIVSQPRPTWFLRIVGARDATVRARAVAGIMGSDGCIYALNREPGTGNGVSINGTAEANFGCAVYSNSEFRAVGTSCFMATGISYVHEYVNGSPCGTPADDMEPSVPFVDPLAEIYTFPTVPSTCPGGGGSALTVGAGITLASGTYCQQVKVTGLGATLNPGIYFGGIVVNAGASATFNPGPYLLVGTGGGRGGLAVQGTATGNGVTFYNSYRTNPNNYLGIDIGGTVNFTAPTPSNVACYTGICSKSALLFYQDPTVPPSSGASNDTTMLGGPSSTFDGILYFPTTTLTFGGNSSTNGYTVLVAYNIKINGNARINANYESLPGGNPLRKVAFYE